MIQLIIHLFRPSFTYVCYVVFGTIFMHCHDSVNILFSSLESFYPCCTLACILFLTASFFLDFIDTLIAYFVKIVKPVSLDLSVITCQLLLVCVD